MSKMKDTSDSSPPADTKEEVGFTMIELLVVIGLAGVLSGFAYLNLVEMSNPSLSAASEISSFLKKARAKALASTAAYTISPSDTETIVTTTGLTCAGTQTADSELTLQLAKASLTDVTWSVCFTSRGFPNSNVVIPVVDDFSGSNTVEVLLGGSIRIQ